MTKLQMILLVFFGALLGPAVAATEEVVDAARTQFDRGMELFDTGKFEEAAIAFEQAYELKPSYKILYNWAQAENEGGNYARALEVYRRYVSEGGDAVEPARADQVRTEIMRLESLVGELVVECAAPGAVVLVDGVRHGETPLDRPILVSLGEREVVVRQGSTELHREVVRVAGGRQVRLAVVTEPSIQPPSVQVAPVGPGEQPSDGGRPKRVWTWVALGIGGAAGIAGGAIGGVSLKKTDELVEKCENKNESCNENDRDERDRIKSLSLTADILYGVAAAGVLTGIILFFVEPDDEDGTAVAVAPAVHSSGAALNIGGRF